jgi:energy-coupling factor transport system permease protein
MAKKEVQGLDFLANTRGDTWFHRLDPRVKLIYLMVFVAVDLVFLDPLYLFLVFLSTIPIWISAKINLRAILPMLVGLGLTYLGLFLFMFSASGVVATSPIEGAAEGIFLGPITFYPVALKSGLVHIFRMAIPALTSLLVFATTDPSDFARAIHRWKAPREIAFLVVMSLRLFPLILGEFTNIRQAQRVRGASTKGLRNQFRALKRTHLPLMIILLRKAKDMGTAVESRAFGARKWSGSLREWQLFRNDYLMMGFTVVFLLTALVVRYGLGLGGGILLV